MRELAERPRQRFVIGLLTLQGTKLVVSLLAARLLAPNEFADWGRLLLIVQYSAYAQLGVTMAVNRDVAVLVASDRTEQARRLMGAALFVAVAGTSIFATAFVLELEAADALQAAAFALLPVLTAVVLLNQAILRSLHRFKDASTLLLLEALGWGSVVTGILAWDASLRFVIGIDVVLAGVAIWSLSRTVRWFGRFTGRDVVAAVASGLPLSVSAAVATLRQTGDLLLANAMYSSFVFAGLVLAATFLRILYFLPTLTTMLWFPDLGRAFGAGGFDALRARTRTILRRYVPAVGVGLVVLLGVTALAVTFPLSEYRELRTLILTKVAAEGLAMAASVCVLYLAVLRRLRMVILANLAGGLPYAALAFAGDPSQRELVAAIVASSLIYTLGVGVGYAIYTRDVSS